MEFTIVRPGVKSSSFNWNYKSYGRIFLSSEDHIEKVDGMIKELDSFEHEYLPNNIFGINPVGEKWKDTSLYYCGKFDPSDFGDELIKRCKEEGIPIKIVSGHSLPEGGYTECLNELYGWDCEFYWTT